MSKKLTKMDGNREMAKLSRDSNLQTSQNL
uniref:Uncharacterized protein n=1 Tax=Rhizophora mucronata TaxID=61149 RepID=A0A2P2ME51_RHIMU